MKYELTAWILNDCNFVRSYDTLEEAQAKAIDLSTRDRCSFIQIKLVSETILYTEDRRDEMYTVYYTSDDWDDFGNNNHEEDFLSLEKAEAYADYLRKQSGKYFDIKIEKYD